MTQTEGEIYGAVITAVAGDEVSYYIHAADESERSENIPYIGAADPFVFQITGESTSYLSLSPDTLFYWDDIPKIVVNNIGTSAIDILDIRKGNGDNDIWDIDHIVPEITSYPYSIAPNESVEIFVEFAIGCSKELWYDSLLVETADSIYFSILANDITKTNTNYLQDSGIELYPNPINNTGEIKFNLQKSAAVELEIFNLQGQLIETLEASRLMSGSYTYTWNGETLDGQDAEKGIYLVFLRIDDQVITKKWVKM